MPGCRLWSSQPTIFVLWLSGILLFCQLLHALPVGAAGPPLDHVRLQLRWHHQFQFAGYYAAIAKGYYRDAGLEVTLLEGGRGANTIENVTAGLAEYGVTNAEILLHRLHGEPLVVMAAIFQHSPLVFLTRNSSQITSPQNLSGKRVKMSKATRDVELQATLRNEGISLDDIVLLEDIATSEDYLAPNIDAIAAYSTNQPFFLKQLNIPFTLIKPSTYGVDFYGDCLFTSEKELKEHPERVEAFRRASLKGWEYALQHPGEIIELLFSQYNTKKSREHLLYEAESMRELILPDLIEMGHMNPGRWQHIAEIFVRHGMAKPGYSLDGFLYTAEQNRPNLWTFKWFRILVAGLVIMGLFSLILLFTSRRLRREIAERRQTELALQHSEQQLLGYVRQTEQFSLSAAAILSIKDEKVLVREICRTIVEYSDYRRVLISLFRDEPPYRELIGFAGVSPEIVEKVKRTDLSKSGYDVVFRRGIRLGQSSYYIPHTMKEILNQDATIYGEGAVPTDADAWHPEDNLFVKMIDDSNRFIGVVSVDTAKSGRQPTDELVRPLEIYASLISQIIIQKREYARREQLESQLRHAHKMEAIGNLTGGIAHDFNNLLGVVLGNAELALLDTPPWSPTNHHLIEIQKASLRARDIVRHLLTFSRRSEQKLRPIKIGDVLVASLKFIRNTMPENIDCRAEFALADEHILSDPSLVFQIVLNLTTNAIQAMEPDGGVLTITAKSAALPEKVHGLFHEISAGNYVEITIEDTGKGIDPDRIQMICDPYYTTKAFGKGTGLGLSIVHGIVQNHHGGLLVDSRAGQGTIFRIYLPLLDHPPAPSTL